MKVFRGYAAGDIPRGMVLGIGNFDGVHLGHQAVIREVLRTAAETASPPGVLTFEPHPLSVVGGGVSPRLIYLPSEKEELLANTGIRVVIHQTFDRAFAALSPGDFVNKVLLEHLRPRGVVVGHDFRFGAGGEGDVALLERIGEESGFTVDTVPEVIVCGRPVRSSSIRELIGGGRVAEAARLLGRPYHLAGRVIPGEGFSKGLGFPTANLVPPDKLVPADGVYAGEASLGPDTWLAAVNIGAAGKRRRRRLVEAHLLGFSGQLYGRSITIRFRQWLREEQEFASRRALAEQIGRDVARVRELAGGGQE